MLVVGMSMIILMTQSRGNVSRNEEIISELTATALKPLPPKMSGNQQRSLNLLRTSFKRHSLGGLEAYPTHRGNVVNSCILKIQFSRTGMKYCPAVIFVFMKTRTLCFPEIDNGQKEICYMLPEADELVESGPPSKVQGFAAVLRKNEGHAEKLGLKRNE